jgi:prephenate dehydratase
MRLGYLGPAGTFSEEAVRAAAPADGRDLVPLPSIHDTVMAVQQGDVDRALVPIENSLEGGVSATLDALATDARDVTIVGETVLAIRNCLIAREDLPLEDIEW